MEDWDWRPISGNFDGRPSSISADTNDGYRILLTLQENSDGILVCTQLEIQFIGKEPPNNPINSRYFQLLGFGDILKSARNYYQSLGESLEEVHQDIESEFVTSDWSFPGPIGYPDIKYAHLAYLYARFVKQGLNNPIDALAGHMKCDRETASSRVVEARERGLLTRPRQGVLGGKLTIKGERLIGIEKGKK